MMMTKFTIHYADQPGHHITTINEPGSYRTETTGGAHGDVLFLGFYCGPERDFLYADCFDNSMIERHIEHAIRGGWDAVFAPKTGSPTDIEEEIRIKVQGITLHERTPAPFIPADPPSVPAVPADDVTVGSTPQELLERLDTIKGLATDGEAITACDHLLEIIGDLRGALTVLDQLI